MKEGLGNKAIKEKINEEGFIRLLKLRKATNRSRKGYMMTGLLRGCERKRKVNEDDLRENIKRCRKTKARSKDVIRARTSPNKSMGFRKILKLKMENIPGSLGLYILGQLDTDKMRINVNKGHLDVDIESISTLVGGPSG
ncbi:hypothetical protein M8C21_019449, partial [Ambrosia artemisiifolia]